MAIGVETATTHVEKDLRAAKSAKIVSLSRSPSIKEKKELKTVPEIIFFMSDILTIILSIGGGYFIRFSELDATSQLGIDSYSVSYRAFLLLIFGSWLATLIIFGSYRIIRPLDYFMRIKQVLKITSIYFFTIGFFAFSFKISISRLLIVSMFLLSFLGFFLFRGIANLFIEKFIKTKIEIRSNLVIIGSDGAEASQYLDWVRNNKKYGFKVRLNILINKFDGAAQARIRSAMQDYEDVKILLLPSLSENDLLQELIWFCEAFECELYLAPQLASKNGYSLTSKHEAGIPFFSMAKPRLAKRSLFLKRLFDLSFALFALIITAPILLVVAVIILVTEGRPIFYTSTRVGTDGIPFNFIKFRTMIRNADKMVSQIQNMHSDTHVLFKNPSDPRITRVGQWMRRYSVDELPQFINVLKGDMSIVGPRPPLISEALQYDDLSQRRLYVRPGITGPWQVSGRSDLDWDMSVRLDLDYAARWKFSNDIWFIFRTLLVVFNGKGAY